MNGENRLMLWTEVLQLPGFVVAHMQMDADAKLYSFTVVPQYSIGVCPHCSEITRTVKQHRTREGIFDLPIGLHAVELKVRVGQYSCDRCGHCFTPSIDFLAEGSHATERLLKRAAELIRHSDISNATEFLRLPEKTLEGWYYAYVERQQERASQAPFKPIRRIGIDELSLKKSTDSSSR